MGIHVKAVTGNKHPDEIINTLITDWLNSSQGPPANSDKRQRILAGLQGANYQIKDLEGSPILFVNEVDNTVENRQIINSHLSTTLDGDLDITPSCRCGDLKDHMSLGLSASVCPVCKEPVKMAVDRDITPTIFLRKPKGAYSLILPNFWAMLKTAFNRKSFNTILYLTDPTYRKEDKVVIELIKRGLSDGSPIERDYNFFVTHLEEIITLLSTSTIFKNRLSAKDVLEFYQVNKHLVHTHHIYFPSKTLLVIENTSTGTYMDTNFVKIIDGVKSMMGIDIRDITEKRRLSMVARLMDKLTDFYMKYLSDILGSKFGAFRMHIYGAKGVTTMRAVITSLTDEHQYDEIHLPWAPTIQLLKVHLVSKLLKRGYRLNDAYGFIHRYTYTYNDEMYALLNELIAESGNGVLPLLIQRFPSLHQGSLLRTNGTKVKPDVYDPTISLPILNVRSLNADFDGDEIHVSFLNDLLIAYGLEPLSPHYNYLDRNKVRQLSGFLALSVPACSNFSKWMTHADQLRSTPKGQQQMVSMFGA